MSRPKLEVADIFRRHGAAWRAANEAHLSLAQRRVMTAIEICRTAALGGHVERCEDCAHTRIAYNSCRNRHCPKCQWPAAQAWLAAREAELLAGAVLPRGVHAAGRDRRHRLPEQGQGLWTAVHGRRRDADHHCGRSQAPRCRHRRHRRPAHLGPEPRSPSARALHRAGRRHIAGRRALDRLPARLLSAGARALAPVPASVPAGPRSHACRRRTSVLHRSQQARTTPRRCRPTSRRCASSEWVVYAKRPFAGPEQVLAYLARYTHRVAISNSRLLDLDDKPCPLPLEGLSRERPSQAARSCGSHVGEFMRRFLLHVLPDGFHRIRHYGLFANGQRAQNLDRCRRALNVPSPQTNASSDDNSSTSSDHQPPPCPCCGGRMIGIETFDGPLSRPYHVRKRDGL